MPLDLPRLLRLPDFLPVFLPVVPQHRLSISSFIRSLGLIAIVCLPTQLLAQSTGGRLPTLDQLITGGSNAAGTEQGLNASVRVGLTYADIGSNDGDFRLEDFDSHIGWRGRTSLSAGLNADGFIELGVRPERTDSFELRIRELWGGLSGSFGLLRAGTQHGTFYELISSATDVAVWGSCWTQFECSRKSEVIKYRSPPAPFVFGLSVVARADNGEGEVADQFEYGFGYQSGSLYFGFAGSQTGDQGELSGGNLLGAVLTFGFSGGSLTLGYQQTDAEVLVGNAGEVTNLTLSLVFGTTYLIYNQTGTDTNEPVYFTLGARQSIGSGASLFYEYQQVDLDDGIDEDLFLRAGVQVDW